MIEITSLTEAKQNQFEDICRLLTQLHGDHASSYDAPKFDQLVEQVNDKNLVTVVALDDDKVVGMALLFILSRTGESAGKVEDVVVSDAYRGKGLGTQIMNKVIAIGKEKGLRQLELTSRASREAANHLYQKVGFEKRDTNVYRLRF